MLWVLICDAIQMSTHNICFYKEVRKKYTGCNRSTTEFLDCALIGVCSVIRQNTVDIFLIFPHAHTKKAIFCGFSLDEPL